MKEKELKILYKLLDKKSIFIITLYKYIHNKLLLENNFILFKIISYFLGFKSKEEIFKDGTIEKEIFSFCEQYVLKSIEFTNKDVCIEEIAEGLNNSYLKNVVFTLKKDIEHIYQMSYYSENKLEKESYIHKDDFFEIIYIKNPINSIQNLSDYFQKKLVYRIILDGTICYNNKILLSKGDILVVNYGYIIKNYQILSKNIEIINIIVKEEALDFLKLELKDFDYIKLKYELNNRVLNIIRNGKIDEAKNYCKLWLYICVLLEKICINKNSKININMIKKRDEIIEIINTNLELKEKEIINLLIYHLEISQTKLYQMIADIFQTTPSKLINKYKINKGVSYLLNSNMNIELISENLGYSSRSFNTYLKKYTGSNSIDFRKSYRERLKNNL